MLPPGGESCQPLNGEDPEKSINASGRDSSLVHSLGISSIPVADQGLQGLRNNLADEFLQAGLYDEYWKWINCQKKVFPFKCLDCDREFYVPFRCDLRICPECSQRYSRIFKARYARTLKQLLRRKKGRDRPMLLTLTTKNTGEIPEKSEIQAHNKAIGKLIRKFFKGGVSVNEVKRTFLHSHCIVYGPYIPHEKLAAEWEALTGNKVVYIQEIKQKTLDVVNYICKYIKKPYQFENNQPDHVRAIQFLKNFKGVRRVHSFGIFYNLPKEKKAEWTCPYCESNMVILQWSKFQDDWNVKDCKRGGMPSYKEILDKWKMASSNQWAKA